MKDELVKALGFNNYVKIYACSTTDALNEIGDRLNYLPSSLDALGQVMSMGAMMGGCQKMDETVTLRVNGDGPIGKIVVDADAHGNIRGYVDNPHCQFQNNDGSLNIKEAIGHQGVINVIKDLKLKDPFVGYSPIITGEIATDFAYYYSVSEQIPTVVSLGVLVDTEGRAVCSGGFMIQLLPNTPEEIIDKIEKRVKILPTISEMLSSNFTPEEIIKNIDDKANILEHVDVKFNCNCSKEKFAAGILSLGSQEIKTMIDEDHKANTVCNFCGKQYDFTEEELKALYDEAIARGK